MVKRLSLYWWCQLAGWGAVVLYWSYYEVQNVGWGSNLLWLPLQAAVNIFFTDVYRRLAHRRGWLRLPPARLLPVVAAAYGLLVGQYMLKSYLVYEIRYGYCFCGVVVMGALSGAVRYFAIWLLAFHLYHYARQSVRDRATAAEASLARLQTELNPHFLFNALNGIKALTREDPGRARTAIDRLSGLLRASLGHSRNGRVRLEEELHLTRTYAELEQLRLEDRLQLEWRVDAAAFDCELPPFSLHTLVENAIKHGIAARPDGGRVAVSGGRVGGDWEFRVTNDGGYHPNGGGGTGLKNLRERLHLQYGPAASLAVSGDGETTEARLVIPATP